MITAVVLLANIVDKIIHRGLSNIVVELNDIFVAEEVLVDLLLLLPTRGRIPLRLQCLLVVVVRGTVFVEGLLPPGWILACALFAEEILGFNIGLQIGFSVCLWRILKIRPLIDLKIGAKIRLWEFLRDFRSILNLGWHQLYSSLHEDFPSR